jgi:endonuclease YncB( thermonuclease family)
MSIRNMLNRFNCLGRAGCFSRGFCSSKCPEWGNTIPFKPPIDGGWVIKVYDGDTITIASKLPYKKSPLYRWSVRIKGIDCPEMKTHNKNEKKVAEIAQSKLSEIILNKRVKLENVSNDKYGRVLADVYYRKLNIGEFMLKNRLAVEYFGKTKEPPRDWLKFYNNEYHPKKEKVRRDVLNHRIALNQTYLKNGMKSIYETDVEVIV